MFNAVMQYDLGEDVNALREMVHRWAQDRVRPMAAEIDAKNAFPNELWQEMGELGLLGVTVPEEYGGAGMGYLAHVIAVEEIAHDMGLRQTANGKRGHASRALGGSRALRHGRPVRVRHSHRRG